MKGWLARKAAKASGEHSINLGLVSPIESITVRGISGPKEELRERTPFLVVN